MGHYYHPGGASPGYGTHFPRALNEQSEIWQSGVFGPTKARPRSPMMQRTLLCSKNYLHSCGLSHSAPSRASRTGPHNRPLERSYLMSLFTSMARITTLTARESEIRAFVMAHPEQTSRMSARELAQVTYSSAASVNRFCKKVGCSGYTVFRMQLTAELAAGAAADISVDGKLGADCSLNDIHAVIRTAAHYALLEADSSLDPQKLERVLSVLRACTSADVYSADDAFSLTAYLCRLMQHAGKDVVAYGPGEGQLDHALHSPAERPAIFISRAGEGRHLVSTSRILKRKGAPIFAVVGNPDSTLARLAQEVIAIPCPLDNDPLAFCQFTTGTKYVMDILYAALYTDSFKDNESVSQACWLESKRLWMLPHGERMQK